MPDFLVSAATGALSPVLSKLSALLSDEYKRFKGVRGEVKFLMRELGAMHAFLLKKFEEENPDVQEKEWMEEVRELSYDIEDSLDDFRVRIDDDSAKPDGFIDKCKKLLEKFKARRQIAKAIQDLKVQVKEVSQRNKRYKISKTVMNTSNVMNTSKVTVDPRALAIFDDASRLVGIDQPKQEVISFLKEEDGGTSSQLLKIVSIVGIGGIGKTTLANRVYQEMKDQFQCQAFFSMSRNPDMARILRTILSQVTGQRYCQTEAGSIQQLMMEIRKFLLTKRYLIVVDDVWDVKTWDEIKHALPYNSCGSVIITTTRIHDVAEACLSLYPHGWVYQAKPLEEHDSKRLFHNRIFGPRIECPENLKEVSDKILKKCGGLPLAIIAISSLLANKARYGVHSVTDWELVQTSIGRGLERDSIVEGMMSILSLSYFHLPSHLKACLLYLSTFPEDYEIWKDYVVRLWVAEGFIPAESTCTLYESGEKSFNELINRNLILPVFIRKGTGEVNSCRLHDSILDFIVCKSTEENIVTIHGIPNLAPPLEIKVRRLSLRGKIHWNQNYVNVRSIISFGFPCFLLGVKFLRVLDIIGCWELQNYDIANIGELLQLRYLGLHLTSITELPEQIGALQYLETLDIRECNIIRLPTALVQLKRLVNLLMGIDEVCLHCFFPNGIENMQALEWLDKVEIDINRAAIVVEQIGELTKMRHLSILFFYNYDITDEESYVDLLEKMVSSFQRLNKLQILDIQFDNYGEAGHAVIFNAYDVIVAVPWCSASLRRLVFMMSPMSRVPSWMKSLVNIEELKLRIKKLDQESLCILADLPVLFFLTLEIVNYVEGIPWSDKQGLLVSNRYGYRSLIYLRLYASSLDRRPSIPMLTFEAGSMPKLEVLHIHFDADITISVCNGPLDFGLKHLSQLTNVDCHMFGTELSIFPVEAAMKKELDNNPKIQFFKKHHYYPSTAAAALPLPTDLSLADLSEQEVVQEPADDAVVCTSGGDVKMSSSTTESSTCPPLTAALPLPTDLSFTIHHHAASLDLGQRRRRSRARQGATVPGQELVDGALHIPDRVKGTSGATPATSDILGPQFIAAPQQQVAFVPPCFTFSSGSPLHAEAEKEAMHCYEPSQHDDLLVNSFSSAFNGLSLRNNHPGSSATSAEAASSHTASPLPTDLSLTIHCNQPSQHDDLLVNAFSSTFNRLSLRNNNPGSSATSFETAYSDTASPLPTDLSHTILCNQPSQHDDLANSVTSDFNELSLHDDSTGSSAMTVEATSSDTVTMLGKGSPKLLLSEGAQWRKSPIVATSKKHGGSPKVTMIGKGSPRLLLSKGAQWRKSPIVASSRKLVERRALARPGETNIGYHQEKG